MSENRPLLMISASAGSGKTYRLAYEYIKLLLWDENGRLLKAVRRYENILAITFTKKATAEMKMRIVEALSQIADGKPLYSEQIARDFPDFSDWEGLRKHARRVMVSILVNYSKFNVSTIDSFFQTVIRGFTRELGLDYNYEVNLDNTYVNAMAIDQVKQKIGRDDNQLIKQWVEQYIADCRLRKGKWNFFGGGDVDKELVKIAQKLSTELFKTHIKEINAYFEVDGVHSFDRIIRFEEILTKRMAKLKDAFSRNQGKYVLLVHENGLTLKSRGGFATLHALLLSNIDDVKGLGSVGATIDKFMCDSAKWDKWFNEPAPAGVLSDIMDCAAGAYSMAMQYGFLDYTVQNLFMFGLYGEIGSEVQEFCKENNQINNSDTNEILQRIINSHEAPVVYERCGAYLDHFLIDEFQDTSLMQYMNLKPLLENSMAERKHCLIIGDEKQSIYRFRNANPDLLRSGVAADFSRFLQKETLASNWRSKPAVVWFNNQFFSSLASKIEPLSHKMSEIYSNVVQKAKNDEAKPTEGYVCIDYEANDKTEMLDRIVERIEALVARGYRLQDIAVLVNTSANEREITERIMTHNAENPDRKIDIITSESLLVGNSEGVRTVVNQMRILASVDMERRANRNSDGEIEAEEQQERVSEKLVVPHICAQIGKMENENPLISTGEALEKVMAKLEESPVLDLGKENSFLSSHNVVALAEELIGTWLSPEVREREVSYLLAFQDCVIDFYNANQVNSLPNFLKWWDESGSKRSVELSGTASAVTIMTIHKSKGLEFPCVILPYANWKIGEVNSGGIGTSFFWVTKQDWLNSSNFGGMFQSEADADCVPPLSYIPDLLTDGDFGVAREEEMMASALDNLNKTYVAFTRPRNELYVLGYIGKTAKKAMEKSGCSGQVTTLETTINDLLYSTIPEMAGDSALGGVKFTYEFGNQNMAVETPAETEELNFIDDYIVYPEHTNLELTVVEDDFGG